MFKGLKAKRMLACIAAAAVLTVAAAIPAMADDDNPRVVFDAGKASEGSNAAFSFENYDTFIDGGEEKVDLFKEFKGVMPGDSLTEEIDLRVKNVSNSTVKIYLKAEPAKLASEEAGETEGSELSAEGNGSATETELPSEESTEGGIVAAAAADNAAMDLLKNENVTLRVYNEEATDEKEITGSLADGVVLGSFTSAGDKPIMVTLDVSTEAGNELAELTAAVCWTFTAEVIPNSGSGGEVRPAGGGGDRDRDNTTTIEDGKVPGSDSPQQTVNIVDNQVPGAPADSIETISETTSETTEEITDNDVPKAAADDPKTGDDVLKALAAVILSALGVVIAFILLVRRRKKS